MIRRLFKTDERLSATIPGFFWRRHPTPRRPKAPGLVRRRGFSASMSGSNRSPTYRRSRPPGYPGPNRSGPCPDRGALHESRRPGHLREHGRRRRSRPCEERILHEWTGKPERAEGFEYHILAVAIGLALMTMGGGRWSVDGHRQEAEKIIPPERFSEGMKLYF